MPDAALTTLTPQGCGAAGEFYAALRLEESGIRAVLPAGGFAGADMMAYLGGASCAIQVKSRAHTNMTNWILRSDRLEAPFVVLVRLNLYRMNALPRAASDPTTRTAYVLPKDVAVLACELSKRVGKDREGIYLSRPAVREVLGSFEGAWYLVREYLEAVLEE